MTDLSTEHKRISADLTDVLSELQELRDRARRASGLAGSTIKDELTQRIVTAIIAVMDARSECARIVDSDERKFVKKL